VIDDEKEYFGRVEEITIRYTVVRTFDLRKVIIPNLTLITKPVRTYDTEEIIRLETIFTVHYGTDLFVATQVIIDAVNALDFIKEKSSTKVNVQKFNESGVDLQVYFYFDPK
jgi:small conductance mechanosensitive channel